MKFVKLAALNFIGLFLVFLFTTFTWIFRKLVCNENIGIAGLFNEAETSTETLDETAEGLFQTFIILTVGLIYLAAIVGYYAVILYFLIAWYNVTIPLIFVALVAATFTLKSYWYDPNEAENHQAQGSESKMKKLKYEVVLLQTVWAHDPDDACSHLLYGDDIKILDIKDVTLLDEARFEER